MNDDPNIVRRKKWGFSPVGGGATPPATTVSSAPKVPLKIPRSKRVSEPFHYVRADQEAPIPIPFAQDPFIVEKQQEQPRSPAPTGAQPNTFLADGYRGSYATSANESVSSESGQIELLRVRGLILEAGYDFPDLRVRSGETTEDGVVRLLQQYRKLNVSLQESHNSLSDSKSTKKDMGTAQNELQAYKTLLMEKERDLAQRNATAKEKDERHDLEMKQLRRTVDELENTTSESDRAVMSTQKAQIEDLNRQIAQLRMEQNKLKIEHDAKISRDRESFKREHEQLQSMHKDQIRKLRAEAEKKTSDEQRHHRTTINALQGQLAAKEASWSDRIKALETDMNARLREQESRANARVSNQEEQHVIALKSSSIKYENMKNERIEYEEQMMAKLNEAQKSQKERYIDEQRRLKEALLEQETWLRRQHEHEKYQLRSVVEDFKLALVAKEHMKGLTDTDIVSRFTRLAREVEDFSRLEWDPVRESEWWSQQLQQLHPRNTRKLKQQIVQNSLWISLREHIFRSPFRLYAEDERWKDLDKDWTEIYALTVPPSEWPKVSRETEKARYENAKQLRAAIDPSVQAGTQDKAGQIKASYDKQVAITLDAVSHKIEKIGVLTDKDRKSLDKIVRLSAELWLECCSQRYRLVVTLARGIEDVLTVSHGNIRLVKLVLKPELRKFGNAHGDYLNSEESVVGWRSAVEIYPPQRAVSA